MTEFNPAEVAIAFADACNEKFNGGVVGVSEERLFHADITPIRNRKFWRICRGSAVFAFYEIATGKLVKAAGWKAPAKRANGELQSKFTLTTVEQARELVTSTVDEFGGFLYIR